MVIRFSTMRPKFPIQISMNRKVKNSGIYNMYNKYRMTEIKEKMSKSNKLAKCTGDHGRTFVGLPDHGAHPNQQSESSLFFCYPKHAVQQ